VTARDAIFERIRSATGALKEKAAYPDYETSQLLSAPKLEGENPLEIFRRNFKGVSGKIMRDIAELAEFLKANGQLRGYCDPALMAQIGNALQQAGLTVETEYDRSRFEDYQFGITAAAGAVAESGSLILNDATTSDRLAALSPWVHVAVLREEDILLSIPDALAALGSSRNIIWATGPSKTADVEGILIEGVHGPGEQIAFVL
jgi:L-lactate dehydrogenase complex protein LldG